MTARAFTIKTELTGVDREIEVIVYDKVEHMRRSSRAHDKRWSGGRMPEGGYESALAVTHGYTRVHVADDGTETPHALAATLRLVRGHLSPEIVSHEVAHLAQHLYGLDLYESQGLEGRDHWDAGNEVFAYLYGGLYATVMDIVSKVTVERITKGL